MYKLEEAGSCTDQLGRLHGAGAWWSWAGQTSWELVRKINISWARALI